MAQAMDLWLESVEKYNARQQDARRWEWVRYFDRKSHLHSQLAADYQDRADRICQEDSNPPAYAYARRGASGPYPDAGEEEGEQAVASM